MASYSVYIIKSQHSKSGVVKVGMTGRNPWVRIGESIDAILTNNKNKYPDLNDKDNVVIVGQYENKDEAIRKEGELAIKLAPEFGNSACDEMGRYLFENSSRPSAKYASPDLWFTNNALNKHGKFYLSVIEAVIKMRSKFIESMISLEVGKAS